MAPPPPAAQAVGAPHPPAAAPPPAGLPVPKHPAPAPVGQPPNAKAKLNPVAKPAAAPPVNVPARLQPLLQAALAVPRGSDARPVVDGPVAAGLLQTLGDRFGALNLLLAVAAPDHDLVGLATAPAEHPHRPRWDLWRGGARIEDIMQQQQGVTFGTIANSIARFVRSGNLSLADKDRLLAELTACIG